MATTYNNRVPTAVLSATYGNVLKWVEMFVFDAGLKSKFDIFDRERQYGDGREDTLILPATAYSSKQGEHGLYKPATQVITYTGTDTRQLAVTIQPVEIKRISTNEKAQKEYAAGLAESLYQGLTDMKNDYVYTSGISTVLSHAPVAASVIITTDKEESGVKRLLANLKAYVSSLFEGVTGSSFSNTVIGSKRIAARDVVIVMNHNTAAMLDAFGYASVFNEDYLKVHNVTRIETDRLSGEDILVMDARNVVTEVVDENLVTIENSDGSVNEFLNFSYSITTAYDGTSNKAFLGYPAKKFHYILAAAS